MKPGTLILTTKSIGKAQGYGVASRQFIEFALSRGVKLVVLDNLNNTPKWLRDYVASPRTVAALLDIDMAPDVFIDNAVAIKMLVKLGNLQKRNEDIYKQLEKELSNMRDKARKAQVRADYLAKHKFVGELEKILGAEYHIRNYVENPAEGTVKLTMVDVEVTMDLLMAISELLGTRHINLSDSEYEPGCDTCGHGSETTQPLFAWGIDFQKQV